MTETEERIFVDAYKDTRGDSEYVNHVDKIIKLGREIMEYLGPCRSLLLEYEMLIGLCQGIYMENVYRTGLEDGLISVGHAQQNAQQNS